MQRVDLVNYITTAGCTGVCPLGDSMLILLACVGDTGVNECHRPMTWDVLAAF